MNTIETRQQNKNREFENYNAHIQTIHKFINEQIKQWEGAEQEQKIELSSKLSEFLSSFEKEYIHILLHISKIYDSENSKKADFYIVKALLSNVQNNCFDKETTYLATLLSRGSVNWKLRLLSLKQHFNFSEAIFRKIDEVISAIDQWEERKNKIRTLGNKLSELSNEIESRSKNKLEDLNNIISLIKNLCEKLDLLGGLGQGKAIPAPLSNIDRSLRAVLGLRKNLTKKSPLNIELTKELLRVNEKLLKYFSFKKDKKFKNLFDRIEYFRIVEELWDEYEIKEVIKEAFELGEEIYTNADFNMSYSKSEMRESFLGQFGEICRIAVEFGIFDQSQKKDLLLKSNKLLIESTRRNGEIISQYLGRSYFRIGLNYFDLMQWDNACRFFLQIKDLSQIKKVTKRVAFEARVYIGDSYLNLGIESLKEKDAEGASQCFKLAEEFYNKADELPKLSIDDGRHLSGKKAKLYYYSRQYAKALPIYKKILDMSNESANDKNFFDAISYRLAECLFWIESIDESIKQFEATLQRNPIDEHKIKSYAWLIKIYGLKHEWSKQKEIKERLLCDTSIKNHFDFDKIEILIEPNKMEEYISIIDNRLVHGDHWSVMNELQSLIKLHRNFEGGDDVVLLTKLGEASIRSQDYESALKIFNAVKEIKQSPKNQAQVLYYVGRVYMEQHRYHEALLEFQRSFEIGRDIGVLILKASAFRKLKQFERAIEEYSAILESARDIKPWITKNELAKTYLEKYNYNGSQSDFDKAIDLANSNIIEFPKDQKICEMLVKMSDSKAALNCITNLISNGPLVVVKNLLRVLIKYNKFHNDTIAACLNRLSRDGKELVLHGADFLMEATIYYYFFKDQLTFEQTVKDILEGLLKHNSKDFFIEYFCARKGAYAEFIEQIYSDKIAKILKPLMDTRGDDNSRKTLAEKILPQINLFIQSEIPENFLAFYNNYKGMEPVGVEIRDKLLKQFQGNSDLEAEEKYILNYAHEVKSCIKVSYPAWFLFEKLVDWFYPYPDGVWSQITSSANKWSLEVRPIIEGDYVQINFNIKIISNYLSSENFRKTIENICSKHHFCPIPKMPWFDYVFSTSLRDDDVNSYSLSLAIKMVQCRPLDNAYHNFNPFMEHIMNSYKYGLEGEFRPKEYRQKAKFLFVNSITELTKEHWVNLVRLHMDWHLSLLFKKMISDDNYRRTIHDCIKGPLQQISFEREDEILEFLSTVDRLPWELARVRHRYLGAVTGRSSARGLNLGKIIEKIIDDYSIDNSADIVIDLNSSSRKLMQGIEPLLIRAFLNLFNNAVRAVKMLDQENKKISVFVFDDSPTEISVLVENQFNQDAPAFLSTRIGLESARNIIEKIHGGRMVINADSIKKIFAVKANFHCSEK